MSLTGEENRNKRDQKLFFKEGDCSGPRKGELTRLLGSGLRS